MEKQMIYDAGRFNLNPERNEVFSWLQCTTEPCRTAFEAEWKPALRLLRKTMTPCGISVRNAPRTLTVFLTLGKDPEEQVTALFRQERYVLGSLLNTLCDEMLFQMDRQMAGFLQRELLSEHLYMAERLEPRVHLSAETLQADFHLLHPSVPFAGITEHGVLFPAKSMMYRIVLSGKPCTVSTLHDCTRCDQPDCLYRSRT